MTISSPILVLALLLSGVLSQPETSRLEVEVVDPQGRPLLSAMGGSLGLTASPYPLTSNALTVRLLGTREFQVRIDGERPIARFSDLPPGSYELQVDLPYWGRRTVELPGEGGQRIRFVIEPRYDFERLDSDFENSWRLILKVQGEWGFTSQFDLIANGQSVGVSYRSESPHQGEREARFQLSAEQAQSIRKLLSKARLFSGGEGGGMDFTPSDGEFATLEVRRLGVASTLVTSGNPSFVRPGPRKQLIELLHRIRGQEGQ